MTDALEPELARYVEDVAVYWEHSGLPRIAGRILGLLLVCDPPHRSASELAAELDVSKASVSTMSRMLLASGIVQKVGVPGERSTYFAIRDDGFEERFGVVGNSFAAFRRLAERGVALVDDPERARRLRELVVMYRFWEQELPLLHQRWKDRREELLAAELEREQRADEEQS